MNRHTFLLSLLLTIGASATAAPAIDTLTLTLRQALDIALSQNPTLKVADREIELKKVAHSETWQRLLPEAGIDSRLDHTLQAAEMKLNGMKFKMGEDGTNTLQSALSVSLPLFAPGVYKAMKMSKTDIQLAVEKSRATKLDLVNQVTKAYYQLLLAQDAYKVMCSSYQLAEDRFDIVNAKYEQGKVSEFDKISAEVQLRSIRPNMVSAHNAVNLSALQLKVLLGIADHEIRLCDNLSNYEDYIGKAASRNAVELLHDNTDMRQLTLQRDLLENNIKMQRMNFVPTLGMSFSYQYQSIYNDNLNVFHYDWAGSSSLLFNIRIPLFRASNFTKMKTAKLKLNQLQWSMTDVERKLRMQVQSFHNNMEASSEQVASNKKNIEQARKAVKIATKRYQVGRGTVLELNSSQVSLTQSELVYNQSIFDYLIAKADLDKVLGKAYQPNQK